MKQFVWLILKFKNSFYKIAGVIVGLISVWLDLINRTDKQSLRNVWKPEWTSAFGVSVITMVCLLFKVNCFERSAYFVYCV